MPRFDLKAEARRTRNIRRRSITLGEVAAPQMLATDLYNSVYRPIIQIWADAAKPIAEEYARTLAQMTTDSPADIQGQIDAAESAATRLMLTLTPSLRRWAVRVEAAVRQRWVRQVFSATSVDLSTRLSVFDVEDTLQSYLAWNVDLVKDVSAQTKKRISDAVFSGLNERRPAREVAKQISEAVGMGRRRAQLIASDQLSKLSASLADQRRIEAGITVWEWRHSGKKHPRVRHEARDGLYYSDVASQVGKSVGGKVVNAPPERSDRPGAPPYCGCRSRSVLVWEWDDEKA
jgi:hypothetical protein